MKPTHASMGHCLADVHSVGFAPALASLIFNSLCRFTTANALAYSRMPLTLVVSRTLSHNNHHFGHLISINRDCLTQYTIDLQILNNSKMTVGATRKRLHKPLELFNEKLNEKNLELLFSEFSS